MTPTRIYVRSVLALHRAGLLKAAAHITGGGLPGNLPRVLPDGTVAALTLTWPVPPVFGWLARTGRVEAAEMLRVFNCGIGMALVVSDPDAAVALLEAEGETVSRIGEIEAATGPAPCASSRRGLAEMSGDAGVSPGWFADSPAGWRMKRRVAILISGRGSNMEALIAAAARSGVSGANRPGAVEPSRCRRAWRLLGSAGIRAEAIDHRISAATGRRMRRRSMPRCGRPGSRSSASPGICGC